MSDYNLVLTPDEFDELERILRLQESEDAINLILGEKSPNRAILAQRSKLQNKIIGKMMDLRRWRKEGRI